MKEYQKNIKKLLSFIEVMTNVSVNRFGEIKVYKSLEYRLLKLGGYEMIKIRPFIKWELFSIHQLVALAFIGSKPTIRHEINHKDLDIVNNYYRNLEWCTHQENINHAQDSGIDMRHFGSNHGMSKLNNQKIRKIFKLRKSGISIKKIAKKFKVSRVLISQILLRRIWKHVKIRGLTPNDYNGIGLVKLTWPKVIDIRFLYNTDLYSQRELATEFKICNSTIYGIISNRTWKDKEYGKSING